MLLDALFLGEPVPDAVAAAASQRRVGPMLHFATTEWVEGGLGRWTFAVKDHRLVSLSLHVDGEFAALAALYQAIAVTLRARHGPPTSTPPDDDEARHVSLLAEGLPDDRYTRLRSMEWDGRPDRVWLSLYLTWPANLELRLSAERR